MPHDEYDHLRESADAESCPVRSSITDQPCLLPAGHAQYSDTRFHKYAPPADEAEDFAVDHGISYRDSM